MLLVTWQFFYLFMLFYQVLTVLASIFLLGESFSWPNNAFWCSMFVHAAGQERFRTLTSSYYRGAQGIVMGISPIFLDIYNRLVNSCYNAKPHCKVLKMVFPEFRSSIVLGHLLCLNCIWWLTCKMHYLLLFSHIDLWNRRYSFELNLFTMYLDFLDK
jgi:hypothetical protein